MVTLFIICLCLVVYIFTASLIKNIFIFFLKESIIPKSMWLSTFEFEDVKAVSALFPIAVPFVLAIEFVVQCMQAADKFSKSVVKKIF